MQRRQNHKPTLLLGLAFTAFFALGPHAFAAEALPDRPGFGYAIHFTSGYAAEALLPVPQLETMMVRPGFGYTINFVAGDPADSLFPVGWAKQRALINPPQS